MVDANGQALAYVYARETKAEADIAKVLKSRSRKSAQDDKWSFCLTVGTLCPSYQERP